MKNLLKKLVPKQVFSAYHLFLVSLAAFFYGYPSRKLRVIGATGTKGKSTSCFLIAKILKEAGYRVALSSTALFALGEREWLNPYKMTMLGRFALQKFIREAVRAKCDYLVLEVSSEGILQHRHRGIEFDTAVFTNLSPEHLEAHGSFEKYRAAKGELFHNLNQKPKIKKNKTIIVNLDDPNAEYFLQFSADKKVGYRTKNQESILRQSSGQGTKNIEDRIQGIDNHVIAENVQIDNKGSSFKINSFEFRLNILGRFNVYNALAALAATVGEGVDIAIAKQALEKIRLVPGRAELIDQGQPYKIVIDYAHEPRSLEAIFETVKMLGADRIIHVFGPTGGGRDTLNRVKLGEISARNADITIITTDDPYDDDPKELAKPSVVGAKSVGKDLEDKLFVVLDRRQAIKRALSLAAANDLVLITGKGSEQAMIIKGQKIPWDDRIVVREELMGIIKFDK